MICTCMNWHFANWWLLISVVCACRFTVSDGVKAEFSHAEISRLGPQRHQVSDEDFLLFLTAQKCGCHDFGLFIKPKLISLQ